MSISVLPIQKKAPERAATPPTRGFTPTRPSRIGPSWARAIHGRAEREVAAAARQLESEIYFKVEARRRKEGAFPGSGEIREMVVEYSRIERHADDQNELLFLFVFW